MNIHAPRATIQLAAQTSMSFCGDIGARIEAESGLLWITQDGDPRDVVVTPGRGHRIDRVGKVVVFALQPSAFVLEEPTLGDSDRTRAPGLWSRLFATPEVAAAC